MTPGEGRQLRTDAERNRSRIIEAATAAFARRGLDVPLEEVADGAGVGIGTLYRRFAGRDELIGACFERRLAQYAEAAGDALEAPDGWAGFAGFGEYCDRAALGLELVVLPLGRRTAGVAVVLDHRPGGCLTESAIPTAFTAR